MLVDVTLPCRSEPTKPTAMIFDAVVNALDVLGQVRLTGGFELAYVALVLPSLLQMYLK